MKRNLMLTLFVGLLLAGVLVLSLSAFGSSMAVGEITISVHYDDDWAYTNTDPLTDVTFTVTGEGGVKATASGTTDDSGFLGTWDLNWVPDHPDIEPGDGVKVASTTSTAEVNPVGTIESTKNVDSNTINGTINAPGQATVAVSCSLMQGGSENWRHIENVSGDNGTFNCDYTKAEGVNPAADIQEVDDWDMVYEEADGDKVYRWFSHDWLRANYSHDWVGANYEAGHSFDITLKDSAGAVKDTATITSEAGGGWGGSGFQTEEHNWASGNPQIEPEDSVLFESDDGYSKRLQIGTINGNLDIDLDEVAGTLNVPWLSGDLPVHCDAWGAPGGASGKDSSAAADGSTPYECAWDPNTEWDIQPGQDVAVWYQEPDTDIVIRVFKEDAPNLNLNKYVAGSGEAAPGGRNVFRIDLYNGGSADATTVTLTDTLPAELSYIDDSSGVTPTINGNLIIWDLGELKTSLNNNIYLVTENTAVAGDTLTNKAEAFSDFDEYADDNYAETELPIVAGTPDLNVGMDNRPGNPVPGETFLYTIDYGNDNATPSAETTLMVEMPSVVTFVDWQSREGYDLWQESLVNNVLTLTAPAVPGNWGDRISIRVKLDEGLQVDDCYDGKATISTANDSNLDNNENTNDFCVGMSKPGAYVDKWFNWGRLYPGGE